MADSPQIVKYAHAVIRVRLFAGLRERAGWSERELDGVERVADVWPALGLGDEPRGLLYAVNREYAERDRELADGDEVALIPPVSGGASASPTSRSRSRPSRPRSPTSARARSRPSSARPRIDSHAAAR